MVAVAILAIRLAITAILIARRNRFLALRHFLRRADHAEDGSDHPTPPPGQPSFFMTEKARWSHEQGLKYERAASHPWLPVVPDPPETK